MIREVNIEAVQKTLDAFASLFTQKIDQQDLPTSLKAATTAIGLCTLPGYGIRYGVRSGGDIVTTSLVVVLVWMMGTSIVSRGAMARNISLVSFWIAATLVIVFLADILFPAPLERGIRFLITACLVFVLIPTHLWRIVRPWLAFFGLTLALWFTMSVLARRVIY